MDTLESYRKIIQTVLAEYPKIPYAYGELESKLIVDRESDHYLLMTLGWEKKKRIHYCLVHIDIIGDKIWIQRDGIEDGIANELVSAGIPKEKIVLAFHSIEVRPYTEYAVS